MSKKLDSSFKNMVLALSTITLVVAVILGSMYNVTKDPIAAAKKAKQESAIKEVLPAFDRLDAVETVLLEGLPDSFYIYKAYEKELFVGAAVQAYSKNGFGGEIKIMVGFDTEGKIVNYAILEHQETPGLGTHMVDWFNNPEKPNQNICGLHPDKNNLKTTKKGGEVDAITAATISSDAFLEAIRNGYSAYAGSYDASSGATEIDDEPVLITEN